MRQTRQTQHTPLLIRLEERRSLLPYDGSATLSPRQAQLRSAPSSSLPLEQRSLRSRLRCRVVTRVRREGRDHGGLGLRSGREGVRLRMEAWLKEKENEQEEDGDKMLNKIYIKTKRMITIVVAA